jgi:hypothetical protein
MLCQLEEEFSVKKGAHSERQLSMENQESPSPQSK